MGLFVASNSSSTDCVVLITVKFVKSAATSAVVLKKYAGKSEVIPTVKSTLVVAMDG